MTEPRGLARRVVTTMAIGAAIVVLGAAIVVLLAGRPPRELSIAAGAPGGAYHAFAEDLRHALAEQGLTLRLIETAGSVENAAMLREGRADIGLLQSGTEEVEDVGGSSAISELFYEPVWLWYRTSSIPQPQGLAALQGKRVAVGEAGSGTYAVATRLLDAYELLPEVETVEVGATDAAQMLADGSLDAAFVVTAANAPVIGTLAADPGLAFLASIRADAVSRHLPYLSAVTVSRGVLDIARDVPPADTSLLAARATLVGRAGLHADIARLLASLLPDLLPHPLVGDPGVFPTLALTQLPVNDDAKQYLEEGPTPLDRLLPFEIASPLSRYYVLLLPLLLLAYPLVGVLKAVYGWYMSSRIVGWYPRIHAIERNLGESSLAELEAQREFLMAVHAQIPNKTRVSAGYLSAYYDLRTNTAFVRREVEERIALLREQAAAAGQGPVAAPESTGPGHVAARRITDEAMGIQGDLRGS